ncbi:DUF547 domain-containing protein [Formosa algae]|uniref:DUF547 domain-containing protein n=1 Tax=Formosa algae TaxID=225843 RepID=A0A9X0YQD1_9FLAO|nr:DUF547 domain-containing protein [Formosa algae]MBP1841296.1 hypothetical protein [Formosa algae]MDQ0336782.1 hypothetical protein [Formosa algae]
MKNYLLFLFLIPTMVFSNSNNTAYLYAVSEYLNESLEAWSQSVNHDVWDDLLQKHVSEHGHVNYEGFKTDEDKLQDYLNVLKTHAPSESWTKNEKLAYWINAYNAFTVKLILDNYPVKSIKDIKNPWDQEFIIIANKTYSLGDIEHKILRKMNEPRIHFAINCASYSCPNLLNVAYKADTLDNQLDVAARHFVNDTSKNTISKDAVEISKIFDWFSGDFKSYGSIIDFLNSYSTIKINANAKVKYKDYNWSLNK